MPARRFLPRLGLAGLLVAAAAATACGPPKVRQTFFPDSAVPCPGGRLEWTLRIVDRRAEQEAHEQVVKEIRDGIEKSFPGCRWSPPEDSGGPAIAIEIYRFSSGFDGGYWNAAADWGISVTDEGGHRLLEFEANEEASRPNYSGSPNEKEVLSQVYERALERTVRGLRTLPVASTVRPPWETAPPEARSGATF
jgi:hypothetical protein